MGEPSSRNDVANRGGSWCGEVAMALGEAVDGYDGWIDYDATTTPIVVDDG